MSTDSRKSKRQEWETPKAGQPDKQPNAMARHGRRKEPAPRFF